MMGAEERSAGAPAGDPAAADGATDGSAAAELERLRRRLERERRARREAESISERVTRDLYEKRAELERLSNHNEVLLQSAGDGICGVDSRGLTTFVNPAAARMLGRQAAELLGRPLHDVVHGALPGPATHAPGDCPLVAPLAEGETRRGDSEVFWTRDGTSFPVEYASTPIVERGEVAGAVVTFKDVTERKRFESQLQYLADHDALTALFNRRRFEEELSRQVAYAARYAQAGAVLLLDLDNFKYVNDTLGHQAGDDLIRAVAGVLRERLRETDALARLGGDEFAVLLPQIESPEGALTLARDLVDAVRRHPVAAGGKPVRVTTSIGLTTFGDRKVTGEELLMEADVAMYEAKDAGRNQVVPYSADRRQQARLEAGLAWTDRIRTALDQDLFTLYAQPIVEVRGGNVSQYELLLRMRGEGDEVILPGAFLPQAERFGLIQSIDRWVMGEAIRLVAEQRRGGRALEVLVEVNLSGSSVGDPELPGLIERELSEGGVDPASLIFEITETAAIANMDRARQFADRMVALGCRFALDDFGAGFGSFYYLKYLPLHYLKIDGEFISNLPGNEMDRRMVRSMVEMARGLGLKTIAEHVEDAETLELLRELRVDYAQGFHVGRPGPVGEVVGGR